MSENLGGFVPVPVSALEGLARSLDESRAAERALAKALEATLELTEDLSRDAIRGLRDRGASAAQIDRYETARRDATRRTREHLDGLREALDAVESSARALE